MALKDKLVNLEDLKAVNDAMQEQVDHKAEIDGYYQDMTVGDAEQLISSKYVENSEPYTFRTSGGSSDIGNREYLDAVVGGTVAWNQAVRDSASENSTDFAPIVTVTDAVEDAAGVRVKLEPVQDLHGYDHPWPAGGGKNLFNPTASAFAVSDLYHGQLIGAGNGESVALSLTDKGNNADISGVYLGLSGNGINSSDGIFWLISNGNVGTLSNVRTNMPYVTIYGNLENTLAKILARFNVQAELATTPTAWTPYSNICPITGWDGVKVTRTGKNLFDKDADISANTFYYNSAGETVSSQNYLCTDYIKVKPGATYYWTINGVPANKSAGTHSAPRIACFDKDKRWLKSSNPLGNEGNIIAVPDNGAYVRLPVYLSQQVYLKAMFVEDSMIPTEYEGFGQTYSITLPSEAGTVYGGELNVATGELVVTHVGIPVDGTPNQWISGYTEGTDGNADWLNARLTTFSGDNLTSGARIPPSDYYRCSFLPYKYSNADGTAHFYKSSNFNLFLAKTVFPDIATVVSWLNANPQSLWIKLKTPTTYQLTPTEIRTLLGTNNVWADTGDVSLTYTGTDEHLTLESGKKYLARISGTDSMLLGSGQEITAAKGTDNVFDLTQMFGSAVADYVYGQGASFFRRWFPNARYPYNAGELKHVEGLQSHDMVGFNQWDEEWENGVYNYTDGRKGANSNVYIRSKNFVPCLPNTAYSRTPSNLWVFYYDIDKNYVGYRSANGLFTTPDNCYYITFNTAADYGGTYKNDICISLSHNGSRNGEYAPYEKHSYPLDSTVVLRGIPKVDANGVYWDGDRYLPDGTVERRYGVVDLGTLSWSFISSSQEVTGFYAFYPQLITGYPISSKAPVFCSKYVTGGVIWSLILDGQIGTNSNATGSTTQIIVKDSAYTNAATFKAAMQGVLLVYELATPTTETAQPYHSTQWVSDWGTEEFVSTGIVPVGTETRYPANLRDKLQHLPDAASGNGSYLITQTDGQMVLTPFPAPPSTAGNYVLKATVVNGVATYTWEVAT